MAKKIFCDVCGEEMTYDAVPQYLKGQDEVLHIRGAHAELEFSVHVKVTPENVGNGEHVDVCGDCRAYLLDKLDTRPKEQPTGVDASVLTFLKGEGQLNGVSFGEKPKGERGEFWWRRYLP